MQKIVMVGRPVPAVRMTQKGKWRSKQAQRYLQYKTDLGWQAKEAGYKYPADGPMEVTATAYILAGGRDMDIDNLLKSFLDALNGIVWLDDKQVVQIHGNKIYVSEKWEERAEIEVRPCRQSK